MADKETILAFLQRVIKQFDEFCSRFNFPETMGKSTWDSRLGPLDVYTSKGPVFEKASLIYCDLTIETPPVLAEKLGQAGTTAEALVVEMNLFPVNPCVPKGYLELRVNITDKVVFAGGTDIFPYFNREDDSSSFANGIKKLCSQYGQDYSALRQARINFFQSKYRKGNVGSHAGIYSFHLADSEFPFFQDLAGTFFSLYGEIVEKRNIEVFTEHDIEHKLKLHGLWAEWILLEDSGTKYGLDQGIPAEALLGSILPPKATFQF
jgi:coproporphyrinogen III oxidase